MLVDDPHVLADPVGSPGSKLHQLQVSSELSD